MVALGTNNHGTGTDWPLGTLHLPSRPPHLHRRWILRSSQKIFRRILGPKSCAGVDFANRSQPRTHHQSNPCADTVRVFRWPLQNHSNSRFARPFAEDPSLAGLHSHGQVRTPIGIHIGPRAAARLSRQAKSGFTRTQAPKVALTVAQKHQASTRILTQRLHLHAKKFCAKKKSSQPSPSKSAIERPNAGANWASADSGTPSKRPPRFRIIMESTVSALKVRPRVASGPRRESTLRTANSRWEWARSVSAGMA